MKYDTQNANILRHMQIRGHITPIDALRLYGCFRLSARIYELKAAGVKIHTERVNSDGKIFARYSLITETIKDQTKNQTGN